MINKDFNLSQAAFSLVELSIVLVILGLLTGGVLTGQSLIRAAGMRSVATDLSRFQTSMYTFRDKYFAYPGDMRNATDFWGNADTAATGGECADNEADVGAGTNTCNGNGDGWVADLDDAGVTRYERFRFWEHLANAGMIEGSYTGVHGSGGVSQHIAGENSPASKLGQANYAIISSTDGSMANVNLFDTTPYIAVEFRDDGATARAPLSPEEQWNIDTKLDDGRPAQGKMGSYKPASQPNCATTDVNATAEYNVTYQDGVACSIILFLSGSFR